MTIKTTINDHLKEAMKAKDNAKRDTLRGIMAAIRQVEVDQQKELSDDDIIKVLMAEAKRRRESIEAFESGGRADDAERERQEMAVIEAYLPAQMSRADIEVIVKDAIAQTGAESSADMGKVMGIVMPKVRGKADGRLVNEVARDLLS